MRFSVSQWAWGFVLGFPSLSTALCTVLLNNMHRRSEVRWCAIEQLLMRNKALFLVLSVTMNSKILGSMCLLRIYLWAVV